VYDQERGDAWAYWIENTNEARMRPPVSYSEIKRLTGIDFRLPIK
jgi:endonuclease G